MEIIETSVFGNGKEYKETYVIDYGDVGYQSKSSMLKEVITILTEYGDSIEPSSLTFKRGITYDVYPFPTENEKTVPSICTYELIGFDEEDEKYIFELIETFLSHERNADDRIQAQGEKT